LLQREKEGTTQPGNTTGLEGFFLLQMAGPPRAFVAGGAVLGREEGREGITPLRPSSAGESYHRCGRDKAISLSLKRPTGTRWFQVKGGLLSDDDERRFPLKGAPTFPGGSPTE